jgi:hypothetical protein
MLAREVKNRLRTEPFVVKHQQIRHENAGALEAVRSFPFARWVVAFFSLWEPPCLPVRSAKKFVSVGKLSGDFTPHKRARNSRRLLLGSF